MSSLSFDLLQVFLLLDLLPLVKKKCVLFSMGKVSFLFFSFLFQCFLSRMFNGVKMVVVKKMICAVQ